MHVSHIVYIACPNIILLYKFHYPCCGVYINNELCMQLICNITQHVLRVTMPFYYSILNSISLKINTIIPWDVKCIVRVFQKNVKPANIACLIVSDSRKDLQDVWTRLRILCQPFIFIALSAFYWHYRDDINICFKIYILKFWYF